MEDNCIDVVKRIEDRGRAVIKLIDDANLKGDSEVQKFYDDAVVFITGASGFVGKHLVEKLLRTTNVKKIYVLLRPKKGKKIEERFQKVLGDPVYGKLIQEKPSFVDKIIPIAGDVSELNLGIDEKSWSMLADEVNVIFHSAATVNFVEKVKLSTLTNVRGTREMIKLAKECKNIKSVVHISTAYSHATKSRIKQEVKGDFYTSPIPPDALIEISENLDENVVEEMCKTLMTEWPNSYTLTKAVAEELVRREKDLPICVVRPSIVVSAYCEPVPGWIDEKNVIGPSGNVVGLCLGAIHVILGDTKIFIDLIPVDFVNNVVIVAAWKNHVRHQLMEKDKKVYPATTTRNPFRFETFRKVLNNEGRQLVPTKTIWYCCAIETRSKAIYTMLAYLFHFIPALLVDGCCKLVGVKPRLYKAYELVAKLTSIFGYFTTEEWFFEDNNTVSLFNELSKTDKVLYNFDVLTMNERDIIRTWIYGIKKYIIKDDMSKQEQAFRKQLWLKILNYIIFPLYLYILFKLVCLGLIFIYNILCFVCLNVGFNLTEA